MMIDTRVCESEKKKYFELYTMEPEFYDINTGQLQQIDAIFYNKNILSKTFLIVKKWITNRW